MFYRKELVMLTEKWICKVKNYKQIFLMSLLTFWYNSYYFFFKKVFGGHIHISFFGATGTPVLNFWWRLLWVSKPEWVLALFAFCRGKCKCTFPKIHLWCFMHRPLGSRRATSPAPTYCLQRWGCRESNSCSQNICESDALPTELNRDRLFIHII